MTALPTILPTDTAGTPCRPARAAPRWIWPAAPDAASVTALAAELRLPEPMCRLLVQRGHAGVEPAKRYLRPKLDQLHDPTGMAGLDRAVARLVRAIRDGETILVHGDYDVDGICSTTLLLRALRGFGGRAVPFIPRRLHDGYDLTGAGVAAAVAAGASVLVTCDCGTNAVAPVAEARAAGIDVIISDHHLPSGPLPECVAVLNPRRDGCAYPDKDLAAVGVAFKLALALARALGASDGPVYRMLDLVALATIADIAPLRGENRVLARFGLKVMAETTNVGLRALLRSSGMEGKPVTAGRVGFVLAPRLNAAGRLGHALRGVDLLMAESEHEANAIARELEELNRERQQVDRETLARVRQQLDQVDLDSTYGLVLSERGWHPGVIGIVASKVVEEIGRPTVLVAVNDGEGKGSGRSISAFDLHAGLGACADLLIRYGGHRAAAGITIAESRLPEFTERFNQIAAERLTLDDLVPEIRVDLEMPLSAATLDFEALLRHFEPFGAGNATPVIVTRAVRLGGSPRVVGGGHLRLRLRDEAGVELEAIGWGMGARAASLDTAAPLDVAYRLERDDWKGEARVQAKLADIRQ